MVEGAPLARLMQHDVVLVDLPGGGAKLAPVALEPLVTGADGGRDGSHGPVVGYQRTRLGLHPGEWRHLGHFRAVTVQVLLELLELSHGGDHGERAGEVGDHRGKSFLAFFGLGAASVQGENKFDVM